jgi:hypothetical protein
VTVSGPEENEGPIAWGCVLRCVPVLLFLAAAAFAQEYTASLSVTVFDPSNALVPMARVVLTDSSRQRVYEEETNSSGSASFASLQPGDYALEISKPGFDKLQVPSITLAVRDQQRLSARLMLSAGTTSVTVTAAPESVATDASMGVSVDQKYIENLPVNGLSVDALVKMAPGITSGSGGPGPGGDFNANGMRSNTNYYTMDGVSLNGSVGGGGGPGPGGPGGGFAGLPPGAGGGSATSSVSLESMQEMRVQTSSFAPEFGRSPGAQISMTSRGGTGTFHGSLYYYFRNEDLAANDWFANSFGYGRAKLRQNRGGGTLGGPVIKNRTFFFASYERLRLISPSTMIGSVPDLRSRLSAPASIRTYLKAFPLPNGPEQTNGAAEYHASLANPSASDSASLRIDHAINSAMTVFARYSLMPTNGLTRGGFISTANTLNHQNSNSQTATAGLTRTSASEWVNDLRFNYSRSNSRSFSTMDDYGGATSLTDASVFPSGVTSSTGQFNLSLLGIGGYSFGGGNRSQQVQLNVVDSLTKTISSHTIKLGLDFRRIMPTYYRNAYSLNATFNGIGGANGALTSGDATNVQITSSLAAVYPVYTNFSTYAQDTWRATDRTTLTYGLRWDVNPAPGVRQGPTPLALSNDSIAGVTQNTPLYATVWHNIAPRFGLAYQFDNTPGRELMLRMGAGLFYDVGYGASASAFNGAPYSNVRTISLAAFPLSLADLSAPAMPPTRPYGQVTAANNNLQSPLVKQWNVTLERNFGQNQTLSLGYAGTSGTRLLQTQSQPSFGNAYSILILASNGATSNYNSLQAQFRRRLTRSLQTQFSYTWAHSIDSASNDVGGGFASILGSGQRGNSDFDIRHNLNWSGTYRLPSAGSRFLKPLLDNWYADWIGQFRTSLPFDVQGITTETSASSSARNQTAGLFAQVRPDYTGAPIWISDPKAPGGRKLNPAAFAAPTSAYAQGGLGRNSLRGFNFSQVDLSLRRQIAFSEKWRLNISVQAFNVLNHANFSNPSSFGSSNLSSPAFGLATRTVGGGVGGGSLYQSGGPRSVELVARLQF